MIRRAKITLKLLAICCLLAGLTSCCMMSCKKHNDGFTPLFNGKDLTGWSGNMDLWSVADGVIKGSTENVKITHNTFLSTEKTYGNFILRIKVKLRNHNSGIQFRSEQKPDHVVIGYQADVATKTYCGMLYEEGKRGIMDYWKALPAEEREAIHASAVQGEWNQYEIECRGDSVKMALNGKVVLDMVDPEGAKTGIIALQLHQGEPMLVEFKDIEIKEL